MWFRAQIYRCQINGTLAWEFSAYGTLVVNVLGSLALVWLATVFLDRPEINNALRLGVTVGFLGALTTFPTFSYESVLIFTKHPEVIISMCSYLRYQTN